MTECPLAKLVAHCLSENTDFILKFTILGEGEKRKNYRFHLPDSGSLEHTEI